PLAVWNGLEEPIDQAVELGILMPGTVLASVVVLGKRRVRAVPARSQLAGATRLADDLEARTSGPVLAVGLPLGWHRDLIHADAKLLPGVGEREHRLGLGIVR